MAYPIEPPVEPMLAKLADTVPIGGGYLFEPKWDGFRALVFRGGEGEVYIQSRDEKPLDRYFPELHALFAERLPDGCILDGEIVMPTDRGLDFDKLQMRLHPAASRVKKLAVESPASFVAFDLLALEGKSLVAQPQAERRAHLEVLLGEVQPPLHLTPLTDDPEVAQTWLERYEGAGLDGVIAKLKGATYQPGKRAMLKIKHARTAECVVAGLRLHKSGDDALGSLLLGLYDDEGTLHHVGVTSSFTMARRKALLVELAPLREGALATHPWKGWAKESESQRMPGGKSRWSGDKDLSWIPLRIERVAEVKYDHLQGARFRHATTFLRWRDDKQPKDCRYDQLEVVTPYELAKIFGAS